MVMELRQKCNDMAAEFDKSMTEMLNDKVYISDEHDLVDIRMNVNSIDIKMVAVTTIPRIWQTLDF